jgi:hypothetical protein
MPSAFEVFLTRGLSANLYLISNAAARKVRERLEFQKRLSLHNRNWALAAQFFVTPSPVLVCHWCVNSAKRGATGRHGDTIAPPGKSN